MTRTLPAGTIRSNLSKIMVGALAPMLFLGVWQGTLTYQDSRDLVAERLRASAWSIAERERDPFIIASHTLQMVSRQPSVRQIGPGCDEQMLAAGQGATGIVNFLRTDRDGFVRCSGLGFDRRQNMAARHWWQTARRTGALSFGEPQIGEVSRRPVVIMGFPVRRNDGTFDGTVSAGISLDRLQASLQQQQRALGGAVLLVDRNGKVLLTAGPEHFDQIERWEGAISTPQMATSPAGRNWIYVAAPLFGRELTVLYAEPQSNFSSAALSRIWLILALPILATVLSLAAVWFATQRFLLDWVPRLHRLTERIARGSLDNDPHEFDSAPTEIAGMGADLHVMAAAIARDGKALHEALEAQKALTRELNHRVRNNLQVIVSLLTMQAERTDNSGARTTLEQARARVSALGLIHRLIYEEPEGELGKVPVSRLLGELCGQLRSANRRSTGITLNCEIADCTLDFDRAVAVLLFVVEAITNAYRHAFGEQAEGRIDLRLTVSSGRVLLEIVDSGSGFGDRELDNGTGLELLHAFAEQLNGKLELDSSPQGLRAGLAFPLAAPA